ncbi:hypothetical protein V6N12_042534 [Hibiscus sabdariffa]|uniref:Protein FAR1-RELATED SEQUENCE n=1 Tax=Hibiscus sabdariffa TaxID=183260 RepID=A0ABR2EF29_9ROSI
MDEDVSATTKSQLCRRLEFEEVVPSVEPMDNQISKQDKNLSEIDSYAKFAISVHANLSDEIIPIVGMKFNTKQDVYDFYNNYAKQVGFSIRRSKGHKDSYGHWINKVFCYSCQDHTHALASLSKRMFLRSQRTINIAQAAELEIVDRLAARAAMSGQSFDVVIGDGEKTLNRVEATLKQLSIEESLSTCGKNKMFQPDASQQNENNEKRVKGIKCKPIRKEDESSIRPKSALEKITKKENIVETIK